MAFLFYFHVALTAFTDIPVNYLLNNSIPIQIFQITKAPTKVRILRTIPSANPLPYNASYAPPKRTIRLIMIVNTPYAFENNLVFRMRIPT